MSRPASECMQTVIDAYVVAWRDVLGGELRAYLAAAAACEVVIRTRRRAEARFARGHPKSNDNKAHALRAWTRNTERMTRH